MKILKYILNKFCEGFVLLLLFSYGVYISWYIRVLYTGFYWGDLMKLIGCLVMIMGLYFYYLIEEGSNGKS